MHDESPSGYATSAYLAASQLCERLQRAQRTEGARLKIPLDTEIVLDLPITRLRQRYSRSNAATTLTNRPLKMQK
jgi:hypothetical protein